MITRIELTNFMSHKHTVIEPAAGLTVLVGPNNVGKSAVVAALQILCHNENSTHVLRHGERECLVRVETDDGHTVEWRRKQSPSYLIDGQQFDRLRSGGLPEELHQALRLAKIDAGNEADFDVHFGMQKAPIFLLGSSAANAARFFASSSDAIRLVTIQKRHKEKHNDAQREKNRLEAESRQLNTELEQLEPVVDVDHRLTGLEEIYDQLLAAVLWLETAEKQAAALAEKSAALAQQTLLADAYAALSAPPQQKPTDPLAGLIRAVEIGARKQEVAAWRVAGLALLTAPPAMQDVDRLARLVDGLTTLAVAVARGAADQTALATLSVPPQLADSDSLYRSIERLTIAGATLNGAQGAHEALMLLSSPPALQNETALAAWLAAHAHATSAVTRWQEQSSALADCGAPPVATLTAACAELICKLDRARSSVDSLSKELAAATADLDAAAAELRAVASGALCPICGTALDPDRIVARAAAGLGGHDHG